MQNASNTWKYSHSKPKEINVTKLVNNDEILTLDNETCLMNLCQKTRFGLDQSKDRWLCFEKNHEHYLQYKGNSAKVHEKNDPFFHQSLSIKLT